jgi:hypothetical protein
MNEICERALKETKFSTKSKEKEEEKKKQHLIFVKREEGYLPCAPSQKAQFSWAL